MNPYYDAGDLGFFADVEDTVERLIPLRAEIIEGDLRPLYLAHLAMASDHNHDPKESREAPVPHGLKKLTKSQSVLAGFCGLSDSLLAAAADGVPDFATRQQSVEERLNWIRAQASSKKDEWLERLISDSYLEARSEILTTFRSSREASSWPILERGRTIEQLYALADKIQAKADARSAIAAEHRNAKRLAEVALNANEN